MSIFHNGKEYGATKVINYSAAPDYNKGVSVTNIQDGNYQATDNGFLVITLQSQQSNVTKVSIVRSKTPIADNEGIEIASRVIQQFQYSETLTVQVMAREYYKLIIDGVGNPQIISCMFYPYASTVPIKLTESIGVEQIEGIGELATADDVDLSTQAKGILSVANGGTGTNDGFDFVNYIDFKVLAKKIGFEIGGTVEDFCLKLPNFCAFVTLIQGSYFSDGGTLGGILRVSKYDNNSTWLYLDRFSTVGNEWRQAIGTMQGDKFSGWKIVRNNDGSIPAELINLPVGFIYIQLRGQSTPDQLFGSSGKWQDISSTYAGEFFRAVGGNSASFGSKQNEGLPNITGQVNSLGGAEFTTATGAFSLPSKTSGYGHTVTGISQPRFFYFNASNSNSIYGSSSHVTPYNSAVRIWKKIS